MGQGQAVLLVPGLGLGGLELLWLRRQLARRGFSPTLFPHLPWRHGLAGKAAALHRAATRLGSTPTAPLHLVGHSMGGVIALACLAGPGWPRPGRVLLLGAPINGSTTADRVARWPGGRHLLGRCMDEARATRLPLPDEREAGAVIGTRPVGVGRLLGTGAPGDGVVSLAECRRDGLAELCIDASHTGMLFTRQLADAVAGFLVTGHFPPAAGEHPGTGPGKW